MLHLEMFFQLSLLLFLLLHLLLSGQFPSTFVEEVTIPSAKPGDRLYVCINDFASAEPGNLPLKRGTDTPHRQPKE